MALSLHGKSPDVAAERLNKNVSGVFRENGRRLFRPFNQAGFARIKYILHPGPDCLFLIVQPVKVNMINRSTRSAILIDQGKGGTANGTAYPLFNTDRVDQR